MVKWEFQGRNVDTTVGRKDYFWWTLLFFCIVITYYIYSKFFSGPWTFDDTRILKGLSDVHDAGSALSYILSNKYVSLLNRPLATASFLLNTHDWPVNIGGFRHINALLHVLNGLLVAIFSFKLVKYIPSLKLHSVEFAVSLAALWMLHPFLASTSYHVIQRMVLLAATFSLVGGIIYLYGRNYLGKSPVRAYLLMTGGLICAGGVGTLAKENAALTPLLIGVLEYTILSSYAPVKQKYWSIWRIVFFGMPALLLVAYFGYYFAIAGAPGYQLRDFGLTERLFSEALILLIYVKQILVPNIWVMGPFQDDLSYIHGFECSSATALLLWLCLIVAAFVWRKKYPLFSFAVLFFITGHLLESTVFPLELYFEHRNYIPSLGILGAVVALAWGCRPLWPKVILMIYIVLIGALLWQTATLWGSTEKAAQNWVQTHPTSFRAVVYQTLLFQRAGEKEKSTEVLYQGYKRIPSNGWLGATILSSQCFRSKGDKLVLLIDEVVNDAKTMSFNFDTAKVVHGIIDLYDQGKCKNFNVKQVIVFTDGLLANPKYAINDQRYTLLFAKARATELDGNPVLALRYKSQAFKIFPTSRVAQEIYEGYVKRGIQNQAEKFADEVHQQLPEFSEEFDLWRASLRMD